jgi:hypothetical protein
MCLPAKKQSQTRLPRKNLQRDSFRLSASEPRHTDPPIFSARFYVTGRIGADRHKNFFPANECRACAVFSAKAG